MWLLTPYKATRLEKLEKSSKEFVMCTIHIQSLVSFSHILKCMRAALPKVQAP